MQLSTVSLNSFSLVAVSLPFHRQKYWLERFPSEVQEAQEIWTRPVDGLRHAAMSRDTIEAWFEATPEPCLQHEYPPEHRYNFDESRLAVGTSQTSRALVNVRGKSSWKVVKLEGYPWPASVDIRSGMYKRCRIVDTTF